MELRHLRYFVAVAEEENFHRAAAKLHVAQSPLSRQMQQLKEEVGVDLFAPAGRGIKLTTAGRVFLERARAILATVDAAVEEARDARGGTIAIGFLAGAAYAGALATIVATLRARQPRLQVKLLPMSTTELWDALRRGEIAFAYGNYAPDDAAIRSVVIGRARIGVLLPGDHPLGTRKRLAIADLANETILMGPRRLHPRLHDDIIAAVRARGVVLNVAPEIPDREALWTLVASGVGLTFAGERSARLLDPGPPAAPGALQAGKALWRPLADLGVELRDVAMWRTDAARTPLLQPLLEIVREVRASVRGAGSASPA